ncbi:5-formyltetrahydrofolate cyclo-ligase [Legionella sp. 27cVA30]|uniref:5-formyltetrahydrofolate cyclo-ligase n=1 Tax=Legionella TaxID=445 RepID=UPI000F8E480D|nr:MULTISPECIES: 5-formyltetrahydrofolate cyclo-ligase [Legionella]MCP0913205.1 5-formyltetrahydrofolate cyclo-ligase [Legionella sp. 27cVA30]RUR17074.1 5-formyltetrahydrofolate cyclo-ligase [Legionella septentrionalis]
MSEETRRKLRDAYRLVRKNLSADYQEITSYKICENLLQFPPYLAASRIGLYFAVNGEASLQHLWKTAMQQGKKCYFPIHKKDDSLSFLPADATTTLIKNNLGILEPAPGTQTPFVAKELDIILIPAVALDKQGHRLGMGAGCYDRTLANCHKPLLIGVAYAFQCVPSIPAQPWDITLNVIATEQDIYWSKP